VRRQWRSAEYNYVVFQYGLTQFRKK
jgi:hypothetical protein